MLGASGAIEAISVILSIQNKIVPPTINHKNIDENIDQNLNLTLNTAQNREINIAMSNTLDLEDIMHVCCLKKQINYANFEIKKFFFYKKRPFLSSN